MARQSLTECFVRFCRTRNILLIPLLALSTVTASLHLSHPARLIGGMLVACLIYYFIEAKLHEGMHSGGPFHGSHKFHHDNPSPESGVPRPWLFVVYGIITLMVGLLPLPMLAGAWLSTIIMLSGYEWFHFLCHCNYKPMSKIGWRIRVNHLKHHNFDDTSNFEMLFPKRHI